MKQGILMRKKPVAYDYEQEWHDPCLCQLNMDRWRAMCAVRDAWINLDASHLFEYLHPDFVYGSFSTKKKLGRDDFIKHLDEKFFMRDGNRFKGSIVNLFRGCVQLDYPYAVQLIDPQYIFNPYSVLHIPRFCGDKIIEIYVSPSSDYVFDVSYDKGIVKDSEGMDAEFFISHVFAIPGDVIGAKDGQRYSVRMVATVLEAVGANVDFVDFANTHSSANIITVNNNNLFVYRNDTRLRIPCMFARRTCGPLNVFAERYEKTDEELHNRINEYRRFSEFSYWLPTSPFLSVITSDFVCENEEDGFPKYGSKIKLRMNEIVRVLPPRRDVYTGKQWEEWVRLNDGYLKRLSRQAHAAWSADEYARSAPVILVFRLLPVKLQIRLLTEKGKRYLKALKDAASFLAKHAKALNDSGMRTPGLHMEAKRLSLMAGSPRFSVCEPKEEKK